jgi:xanthine dehydrogenase accessory factor
VVVTDLAGGTQRLVLEAGIDKDALGDALRAQIRTGKSGVVETAGGRFFLELHLPPPRLVITGAVHVSQALAPMARMLGYDVSIVDPRTAFATAERFPDVALHAEWPDTALPKLGLDHWTAFVALTHDPKIDEPALVQALAAGCFYVGALGSKRTHGRRVESLRKSGVPEESIARIHAPIGLSIGAASPPEIALAILAEITMRLRRGPEAKP